MPRRPIINKEKSKFLFAIYLANQKLPSNKEVLLPNKYSDMVRKLMAAPAYQDYVEIIRKYTNRKERVKGGYFDVVVFQKEKNLKTITKKSLSPAEYNIFWQIYNIIDKEYLTPTFNHYQQKIKHLQTFNNRFSIDQKIINELNSYFKTSKVNLKSLKIFLIPWWVKNNYFGKTFNSNIITVSFPLNKGLSIKSWHTWEKVFYHELIHAKYIKPQIQQMINKFVNQLTKSKINHLESKYKININQLMEEIIVALFFPNGILSDKYFPPAKNKIFILNKKNYQEIKTYLIKQRQIDRGLLVKIISCL